MLQTSDILRYNNDLWISQEYLISTKVVDAGYLRVAKTRANKGAQSYRYETILNRCYFSYTSLPRTATSKMPDAGQLNALAVEVQNDRVSLVSRAMYSSFKLFLKQMSETEARSAAVVHEASIYVRQNKLSFSKSAFLAF